MVYRTSFTPLMKLRLALLFCLLSLLFGSVAHANSPLPVDTTIKHTITEIYTEKDLVPYNIWQTKKYADVDTTIDRLEFYTTHYTLGNPGLPYVPVIFNSTPQPLGFFYGYDHLTDYVRNDTSVRYYTTRAPYLNFFYITDPMIHQFLDLSLTQNFGKKLNIALEFHRLRSQGDYINQGSNDNQLALTVNYRTKRYMLLFNGIYNIYKIGQNGGVQADSAFFNPSYTSNRQDVPVYLSQARSMFIKTELRLQQFYFFGYKSGDTVKTNPLFYISHCSSLSGSSNVYVDHTLYNDSDNFYRHTYRYDSATYDSLRYNEFNNDFTIGSASGWHSFLKWDLGVKDQWVHFTDYVLTKHPEGTAEDTTKDMYRDSIFSNLIAHARVYNTYDNGHILFDAAGSYIFSGTQKGDEQGSADLGIRFDSLRLLKFSGNYSLQTPALLYDMYDGNNYQWMNHFAKTTTSTASVMYTDAKWHLTLGGEVTEMQNMAYFTNTGLINDALPAQYNGVVNIMKANIEKDFRVGKWHFNTKEIYQYVPNGAPIHLPTWVAENSLFYENNLFHHHLLLKVGIDTYYNTAYYVYGYQPVYNQFYLQGQTKMGNYIYVDPFVAFRVKTFRMFLKLENAAEGLLQPNVFYGYAVNYPMPDRVLRFGISWDFWN